MTQVRGFTLIEMIVVLAVMALAASVAPVAVERMLDGASYRATLRDLMASMRGARNEAIGSGEPVRFVLDLNERRFGVGEELRGEIPADVDVDGQVALDLITPEGQLGIMFYPDGSSTGGSIFVRRASGVATQLRVGWLLGRVSQHPG